MATGLFAVFYELVRPGAVLPGVLGMAAVVGCGYSLWQHTPRAAGLGLLFCATVLLACELLPWFRFLSGTLGTVALSVALCHLFKPPAAIRPLLAIPIAVGIGATIVFLADRAKQGRLNKTLDL